MKKGKLITLEGPDGSGKTTQIEFLENYLRDKGYDVIRTREPGGTDISEKIREIILDNKNSKMCDMCEALLYAASRAQLVEEVIKPAIEDGKIVICDRFVHSSIIYQGIGRSLGIDRVKNINEAALNGLEPDLTVMLNIPYEIGIQRKKSQKELDRLENSGNYFHKKVYNGYLELSQKCDKIKVIDANREANKVYIDIINLVDKLIESN